jgi:glucose uptake protein GlcU
MFERVYDTFSFGSFSMSMWDKTMLRYAFYLFLPMAGLSIIGVILNGQRHKRKRDRYNKSLFITGFIALAGSIFYYIFYLM